MSHFLFTSFAPTRRQEFEHDLEAITDTALDGSYQDLIEAIEGIYTPKEAAIFLAGIQCAFSFTVDTGDAVIDDAADKLRQAAISVAIRVTGGYGESLLTG